jgi:hypothetical protein
MVAGFDLVSFLPLLRLICVLMAKIGWHVDRYTVGK